MKLSNMVLHIRAAEPFGRAEDQDTFRVYTECGMPTAGVHRFQNHILVRAYYKPATYSLVEEDNPLILDLGTCYAVADVYTATILPTRQVAARLRAYGFNVRLARGEIYIDDRPISSLRHREPWRKLSDPRYITEGGK